MRRSTLPRLVILTGKHRGARLNLPHRTVTVGRDEGCAVRLNTHEVSREHCTLRIDGDQIFVKDLGSRNGTFINDHEVAEESALSAGDILRVGPMLFQMETQRPELPEPPAETFPSSDDSIANWLAEDEPDQAESSDTAVMTTDAANAVARNSLIPPPGKDSFDSVADEAADIIRRHEEWKKALAERGLEMS